MSGAVVVTAKDTTLVVTEHERAVVVTPPQPQAAVVVRGVPGPAGPQGEVGPPGGSATVPVGALPLSGHSAVAFGTDGLLAYADCANAAHLGAVAGVIASAYAAGAQATVQTDYDLVHAGWSWAVGPVFVGANGALVQALPTGAVFSQVIGYALAPTRLRIALQPPILIS